MAEQPVVIKKIAWESLFPWLMIFRTLPIAATLSVLAFSLVGVVVAPIGWRASEALFVNDQVREDAELAQIIRNNNSPYRGVFLPIADGVEPLEVMGVRLNGPREVFRQYVAPFRNLFRRDISIRKFGYFFFGAIWTLALWSFVGIAICRVSLSRLTRNEFLPMDDAFEFAMSKWTTALTAIGAPLISVAILCLPLALLGLLMMFDIGLMFVGLAWILVVLGAILMGLLLFGLMFSWPMMICSVACEGQNAFDAMTRSYAYACQRPLHYLFYAIVAILFGGVCWIIIGQLTDMIIDLTWWSTSWGANFSTDRISALIDPATVPEAQAETQTHYIGRNAIGLWMGLVKSLATAFLYGMFWCMASAIYLLLRKDVDETETDEIFISEEQRTYQLPPLQSDENGIPQVIQSPQPEPETTEDDQSE